MSTRKRDENPLNHFANNCNLLIEQQGCSVI
jgi:hypothetical protein